MDILNLYEFREYYKTKKPTVIIFDDENNAKIDDPLTPLSLSMYFDDIIVAPLPPAILLKSQSGTMQFDYIMNMVTIRNHVLGDIVTIYSNNCKQYKLILR